MTRAIGRPEDCLFYNQQRETKRVMRREKIDYKRELESNIKIKFDVHIRLA